MRKAILLLGIFLLFFGCITESPFSELKKETADSFISYDFEDDGINDFTLYSFNEYLIEGSATYAKRYVYSVRIPDYSLSSFKEVNEELSIKLYSWFENFKENELDDLDKCTKSIGLKDLKCLDWVTCNQLCSGYSSKCKSYAELHSEFLSDSILSFEADYSSESDLMSSISKKLFSFDNLGDSQKLTLLQELNELYYTISKISANPLYSSEDLKMCERSSNHFYLIKSIMDEIGEGVETSANYEHFIILAFEYQGDDSETYSDLVVKDDLSSRGLVKGTISTSQDFSLKDNTMEWSAIRPYLDQKVLLFYTFESTLDSTGINWKTPAYKIKTIDFSLLSPVTSLFDFLLPVMDYYSAFSISIAIFAIIILLIIDVLILVFNIIIAKAEKKSHYKAVKGFAGVPNREWFKDLLFAVFLLVVGFTASYYTEPVDQISFSIPKTIELMFGDYLSLITLIGLIAGPILLYLALQSKVKAMMIEKSYKHTITNQKKDVAMSIEDLKIKIDELKSLAEKAEKKKLDVSKVYSVLDKVSLNKAKLLSKKQGDEGKNYIEKSFEKIEDEILALKDQDETSENKWDYWKKSIRSAVENNDVVPLSTLAAIPPDMREWAVKKFIKETDDIGLVLENDTINKKAVPPGQKIDDLFDEGLLEGAIILKDGKPTLSRCDKGHKTVLAMLTAKLHSYLSTFVRKSNKKSYKYVMGIGRNTAFIFFKKDKSESLIFAPKEKFQDAFNKWKAVLPKM